MKFIFLLSALIALTACAVDANGTALPSNVQLGADAITARQTSDAANARTNALSAQATAIKQTTRDAQDAHATDAAIQLAFANVTATAQANAYARAEAQKTENAQAQAQAATQTAEAHKQATSAAETAEARKATRQAVQTQTRIAEQNATATAVADRPTQTRIAEIANDERTARERQQAMEVARANLDVQVSPIISALWNFVVPLVFVCAMLVLILYGTWRIVCALERYIEARALSANASAYKNMVLLDRYGNPVGLIVPQRSDGTITITRIGSRQTEAPEEEEPQPPLLLTDSADRHTPAAPEPPREDLVNDMIHRSDLKTFTQLILDKNDWTQATWANYKLPRGFVLTTDTKDAQRQTVYGGYSRVMQLYVNKQIILNRRKSKSGEWNQLVARDAEIVTKILTGELSAPDLPAPARDVPTPYPTASRSLANAA